MTNPLLIRLAGGEEIKCAGLQLTELRSCMSRAACVVAEINRGKNGVGYTKHELHRIFERLTESKIDDSLFLQTPFYTDFGSGIRITGKNVQIGYGCNFMCGGGITIEDDVIIGNNVAIVTSGYNYDSGKRDMLCAKPVVLKKNSYIKTGAKICAGVTVGENSVVTEGAVVTCDVPDNCVYGGNPAVLVQKIGTNAAVAETVVKPAATDTAKPAETVKPAATDAVKPAADEVIRL
jgi:acetyltransferase-like isoleucine patch superfamily enzyme